MPADTIACKLQFVMRSSLYGEGSRVRFVAVLHGKQVLTSRALFVQSRRCGGVAMRAAAAGHAAVPSQLAVIGTANQGYCRSRCASPCCFNILILVHMYK